MIPNHIWFRSSHSQMFFKQVVLRNFANFTGKLLCWTPFLIKLKVEVNKIAVSKETPAQVFSCEICEIFKDNFFTEHLQWLFLLITGYKTLTFPCLLFLSISISISQCFPLSSYIFCFYHSIVLLRQGWTQKLKRKMVNDRWRTSSA